MQSNIDLLDWVSCPRSQRSLCHSCGSAANLDIPRSLRFRQTVRATESTPYLGLPRYWAGGGGVDLVLGTDPQVVSVLSSGGDSGARVVCHKPMPPSRIPGCDRSLRAAPGGETPVAVLGYRGEMPAEQRVRTRVCPSSTTPGPVSSLSPRVICGYCCSSPTPQGVDQSIIRLCLLVSTSLANTRHCSCLPVEGA